MTWRHALTLVAEWLFLGLGVLGLVLLYRLGRVLWRRWRVRREWAELDRISLEAIARMERKS